MDTKTKRYEYVIGKAVTGGVTPLEIGLHPYDAGLREWDVEAPYRRFR
jgi:hypothetical protein